MIRKHMMKKQIGRLVGLALVATFALGAVTASASASPPENLQPPTTTPEQPEVGEGGYAFADAGLWTEGEASYKYQWYRCDSKGSSCSVIGGATSSLYYPVAADAIHTLVVEVTGTNSEGSASAKSAPTKLLAVSWQRCKKVTGGSGVYGDSGCTVEGGSKAFSKVRIDRLGIKEPFTIGSVGGGAAYLEWTISGVKMLVQCTTLGGEGKLSNLATGPNTSETKLRLTGCVVLNPSNCTVKTVGLGVGEIGVNLLTGTPLETSINPPIKFSPSSGSEIMSFVFEGGKCTLAGVKYTVSGYLKGEVNNSNSTLAFGNGATTATVNGGNPFRLQGSPKIATTAGETLSIAP
jgi:hypothetical protein